MPAGWEVINNSTGGNGLYPTEWVVVEGSDPCGDYSGNMTGGDGSLRRWPTAIARAPASSWTRQLITPSVNLSGFSSAVLRFNEDYRFLFDNADVDVSIDGGSSWTNVLAQTSDARGPRQVTIDITATGGG